MSDPEALWRLSEHDVQYVAARNALKALPQDLEQQRRRANAAAQAREQADAALADLKKREHKEEHRLSELRTAKERAEKALRQGFGDYQAAERQVAQTAALIDEVETGILELLEAREEAEETLEAARAEAAEQAAALAEAEATLPDRTAALKAEATALYAARTPLRAEISELSLRTYDRVVKQYVPAVVPILKDACKACHRVAGPRAEQTLRKGEAVSCTGCGRLLVLEDQMG